MSDNLKLWDSVEKTNPEHTKGANVRGNKITAIACLFHCCSLVCFNLYCEVS